MGDPVSLMAAGSSIASVGLNMASKIGAGNAEASAARATAAGDEFKAQQSINNAEIGRQKAAQTGSILRNQLEEQIAKISAVRASSNTDPASPTNQVLTHYAENVGDMERQQRVANINLQVAEDTASSRYYTAAASGQLSAAGEYSMSGYMGAAGSLLSGLSGLKLGGGTALPGTGGTMGFMVGPV
jgi:hypothetical protein